MSDGQYDSSDDWLPSEQPELEESPKSTTRDVLPSKSKQLYETTYDTFVKWKQQNETKITSEPIVMMYFNELSKKYKPSTLWSIYSMLKATVNIQENIDISNYNNLKAFMKKESRGFKSKKSNVLSCEEIEKFLTEAPDNEYLAMKTALIFGICGGCRSNELVNVKVEDIAPQGDILVVNLPASATKKPRTFVITEEYSEIVKKYMELRSRKAITGRFFLNFQRGKCTAQVIGVHKFSRMPKEIATYLKLDKPENYTADTFRRTSATLLADSGVNITVLKRYGRRKSSAVAESRIEECVDDKSNIAKIISASVCLASAGPSNSRGYGISRWYNKTQRDVPKEKEVVLVTGCDTGLGYSLAIHLRSIGFRVIASVHKSNSPGAIALSKLTEIFVHQLDITINESVKIFGKAVREYLDENQYVLRGFVNNAGAMIFGEFEWQTDEQTRYQIEVNIVGTMRVTREFMPTMRKHLTRLIVVTSHCAGEPLPGVATYGATKAALNAWAIALRVELKKCRIDVACFVPGSFIGESNLLSQQGKHFESMYAAMDEETRAFYGNYFTRYANYLSNITATNLPRRIMDRRVYDAFEGALLDRQPKAEYRCEPWRYMLYRIMFKISPTKLRDNLVEWFVKLPAWDDKNDRLEKQAKTT